MYRMRYTENGIEKGRRVSFDTLTEARYSFNGMVIDIVSDPDQRFITICRDNMTIATTTNDGIRCVWSISEV
jgi:hypothetical protein